MNTPTINTSPGFPEDRNQGVLDSFASANLREVGQKLDPMAQDSSAADGDFKNDAYAPYARIREILDGRF